MARSSAGSYIVESAKISLDVLEDISSALPAPVGIAVKFTKRIIAAAEEVKNNRELCNQLRDRLLRLILVILMQAKQAAGASADKATLPPDLKNNIQLLQTTLESISKEVENIQSLTTSRRKRHKVAAFFLSQSHAAALTKCCDELEWAMREFNVSSSLSDAVRLWAVSQKVNEVSRNVSEGFRQVRTNSSLQSLPRAKYAGFDSERPDRPSNCFEGTRTAILETIFAWVLSTDPEITRFYWMKGIAGVGKTTIARTIAELCQNKGVLGGQFFFSRQGEAELRNPALVFPTIAYQLARFDPEFCQRITAAIEADPDLPYAGLRQQLEGLIIRPLSDLKQDPTRVVAIIFDAFDECEPRGAKEILQLLVAAMPRLPFFLKIFVTSRPEPHIRSVLVPSTNLHMTALHDIEESIVQSDIRLYLEARLRGLPAERDLDLPVDWIKDHEIDLLAKKAGNLFIYAETSLRFLSDSLALRAQLNILLEILESKHGHSYGDNPHAYLDDLYLEILLRLVTRTNGPEVTRTLQPVLGSIVLLRDPLPVDALERLVQLRSGEATGILPLLGSVVLPPAPPDYCPRVYHPSFPDFLQDAGRCPDQRFRVDTESHETRLALCCLELLNAQLHMSMMGDLDPVLLNDEVEDLGEKIQSAYASELQYACRFWASHVVKADTSDERIANALEMFAAKSLLAWIEAMSWLGETRLCLTSLADLKAWAAKCGCSSVTKDLLGEGHRMLLAHSSTISQGALHIRHSILPFLPRNSRLLHQYGQYVNSTVAILRGEEFDWSPCLMVWTAHNEQAASVVFSPDGSRLASGSIDGSIRVWDATAGNCLLVTLEGHSKWVRSVTWSPDGSRLASGSDDKTARLWDATTGVCITILNDHSDSVWSIAFSPDGTRLASGSRDKTIRVRDTEALMSVIVLKGHTDYVTSVAFSSDGTRLASGSLDKTVRVWDVINGKPLATLKGHSKAVRAIVFSPTDSRLASGSEDSIIRIWDVTTFTCLTTLQGHEGSINSLSFSPDSSCLASGSGDRAVRIWDSTNGACLTTFHGHSRLVASVSFSPDSSRLASASHDKTIRIWDMATTTDLSDVADPEDDTEEENYEDENEDEDEYEDEDTDSRLASVSFLGDGALLECRLAGYEGWVWNAITGKCLTTFKARLITVGLVGSVAFSPDGSRVASALYDHTIRVLNRSSGKWSIILRGHSDHAMSVVFSPDGTRLASGSDDLTVRVWDLRTQDCLAVLEGHRKGVTSIAYCPDGSRLASASTDETILVWDAINGACLATLQIEFSTVHSIAFSPDDSFIISTSWAGDLHIWNAFTYDRIDPSGSHVPHSGVGETARNHLDVETGRLVRIDPSGVTHLICFLPPSFLVHRTSFVEFSPSQYRVALIAKDLSLLVLEVSLS